jgi:hypothetical protein
MEVWALVYLLGFRDGFSIAPIASESACHDLADRLADINDRRGTASWGIFRSRVKCVKFITPGMK